MYSKEEPYRAFPDISGKAGTWDVGGDSARNNLRFREARVTTCVCRMIIFSHFEHNNKMFSFELLIDEL